MRRLGVCPSVAWCREREREHRRGGRMERQVVRLHMQQWVVVRCRMELKVVVVRHKGRSMVQRSRRVGVVAVGRNRSRLVDEGSLTFQGRSGEFFFYYYYYYYFVSTREMIQPAQLMECLCFFSSSLSCIMIKFKPLY